MKNFLSLTSLTLVTLTATTAYAATPYKEMPTGTYTLDKTHASLIWKVSHLGLSNYAARFTDFDASLDFDATDPSKSTLSVTIDPTSIKTDYPYVEKKDFDKKLIENEDWFNSNKFPKITFVSTQITQTDESTGTVEGNLTFLGVTKPVSLNVTFNGAIAQQPFSKKPTLGFSATGSLKRSDFGFDKYVPNVGDEVTLSIEAEFGMDE